MKVYAITLAAGVPFRTERFGRYFRLVSTSAPLVVNLYKNNAIAYDADNVEGGFWAVPEGGFDAFELVSAGVQTVYVGVSLGNAGYDRSQGSVQITGPITGGGVAQYIVDLGASVSDNFSGRMASGVKYQYVEDGGTPAGITTFKSTVALAANTPENVFGTGSNTFGAMIWRAENAVRHSGFGGMHGLVHGTGAPGTLFANDPIMIGSAGVSSQSAGTTNALMHYGQLMQRARLASGRRLDFIDSSAESEGYRHVEYSLLSS
jgi:hypothetical protein